MSAVQISVLGTGRIGAMHAELIDRRVPGATLAGVFDVDDALADRIAGELDCRKFESVDDALADADAVAICTSTDTHADLIVQAAAAGRPIFCEKPLSLDLGEVDRSLAAVAAADVPMQIGFNRRFDPSHAAVAAAVADGSVGDVEVVRITSRDPAPPPIAYLEVSGGIFLDMTVHDFDMARFVTGSEVDEVYAVGAVRVDPAISDVGDLDTAVVTLRHANGAFTTIDNSRRAVYGYDQRVEAFGSGGVIASDNELTTTTLRRDEAGGHSALLPYFFIDRYIPSYLAQWAAFVSVVADGTPPLVGPTDGRAPLVIGLAAWQSVREGRPVACDEIG